MACSFGTPGVDVQEANSAAPTPTLTQEHAQLADTDSYWCWHTTQPPASPGGGGSARGLRPPEDAPQDSQRRLPPSLHPDPSPPGSPSISDPPQVSHPTAAPSRSLAAFSSHPLRIPGPMHSAVASRRREGAGPQGAPKHYCSLGLRRAHPPPRTSLWGTHSPSFFQTLAVTGPPLHLQTHALPCFQGLSLERPHQTPSPLVSGRAWPIKGTSRREEGGRRQGVPTALVPTLPHHGSPRPLPPERR